MSLKPFYKIEDCREAAKKILGSKNITAEKLTINGLATVLEIEPEQIIEPAPQPEPQHIPQTPQEHILANASMGGMHRLQAALLREDLNKQGC